MRDHEVSAVLDRHAAFRRDPAPAVVPPELVSPEGDLGILPQRHRRDGAAAIRLARVA